MLKKIGLGLSLGMILTYVLLGVGGWLLLINAACSTEAPVARDAEATNTEPRIVMRHSPVPGNRPSQGWNLPAPPPDPRSSLEIAQAACAGHCPAPALRRQTKLGSVQQAIIPTTWTVPQWEIDPSNTSGCAADTNSGTASTCTGGCVAGACPSGIGPLLTCNELTVHRWGTNSPRLRQQTIVEWTSTTTNTADECYFNVIHENAALILRGVPTTVCTGTLGAKTAKSHGTNTLLSFAGFTGCSSLSADQYVLNTTRGSGAFIFKTPAAPTLSQPLPTFGIPWNGVDPNEDDTWTAGDSITVETFPTAFIGSINNTVSDTTVAPSAVNATYIQHLSVQPSANTGFLTAANTGEVFPTESVIGRELVVNGIGVQGLNVDETAGITGLANAPNFRSPNGGWKAGIIRQPFLAGASLYMEAGVIVTSTTPIVFQLQSAQLNDVFIDTNMSLIVSGNNVAAVYANNTAPFIWGPGAFGANPPANILINAATSVPTLFVATIQEDGLGTACSFTNAQPSVINCNITITPAHIDAAAGAAGFGGAAINPAGAVIETLSAPF